MKSFHIRRSVKKLTMRNQNLHSEHTFFCIIHIFSASALKFDNGHVSIFSRVPHCACNGVQNAAIDKAEQDLQKKEIFVIKKSLNITKLAFSWKTRWKSKQCVRTFFEELHIAHPTVCKSS